MNLERIIYCLYCPITKVPVYIGKTKNGIDRPWKHIEEKSHNKEVNKWVNSLKENGLQPVLIILDEAEDDIILTAKESFWIQRYISQGNTLLNLSGIGSSFFTTRGFYNQDDPIRDIRTYIYHKRKSSKLTQAELGKKAGVGLRFIREIEQGVKENFSTSTIQKILNLFGGKLTVE